MAETKKAIFEPNGLLDFFPTPPQSTGDADVAPPPPNSHAISNRPDTFEYDDEPPPPDFDEEPSDFEDEVMGIMEREKESSSSSRPYGGMDVDFDDEDVTPVASCKYLYRS